MSSVNGAWPEGTDKAQALVEAVRGSARASMDLEAPLGARARVWSAIKDRLASRSGRAVSRWAQMTLAGLAVGSLALVLFKFDYFHSRSLAGSTFAADSARRSIDLHGDARVVLSQGSRMGVVEDDAGGLALSLERGSVLADVNHRPAGAPLTVRTPRAVVRVVGTVLWVDVAEDGSTTVLVGRGAVEVTSKDGAAAAPASVSVMAGERLPHTSVRSPDPADLSLLGSAAEGTRFAPPAVVTPTVPPPPVNPCSGLTTDASIGCLEQLSATSDALRAERALYEIGGRILRDRGDAKGAIAAWEKQRSRFPHGALRPEADLSIIEALVRLGDTKRAGKALKGWLAAHPRSLAAPEAHYLRGKLYRAAGHCKPAIREFDLALRSPADPWAAEAKADRAACQSNKHH